MLISKQMEFIRQLDNDTIVCLSSNKYYLNLIEEDSHLFRIDSEQKIIYFAEIASEALFASINQVQKQKMYHKIKFLIVFNRKLEWKIFLISKNKEPQPIFYGKIPQSDTDIYHTNASKPLSISIINLHQVNHKFLILTSTLAFYEIMFNQQIKINLFGFLAKGRQNNIFQQIKIKCELMYPLNRVNAYLTESYLPSLETNTLTKSLLIECFQQKQYGKRQSQKGCSLKSRSMLLVFSSRQKQSHCIRKDSQTADEQFCFQSIYQITIDLDQMSILSGKQCLINIPNKILELQSLNRNTVMIQTQSQLYVWDSQLKGIQSVNFNFTNKPFDFGSFKFINNLTPYLPDRVNNRGKVNFSNSFVGIIFRSNTSANQSRKNNELEYSSEFCCQQKILKLTYKNMGVFAVQELLAINEPNSKRKLKQKILFYLLNANSPEQSFVFLDNYSIKKYKNLFKEQQSSTILKDHSVTVNFAKLSFIKPNTNILYANKKTGFSQSQIIMTNSLLEVNKNYYRHNLPLRNAKIIKTSTINNQNIIFISSPLIGTLPFKIGVLNQKNIEITSSEQLKPLTGYQTLAMSQSGKIFVHPHQIIFSLEANKQGKYPSIAMSKLFQNSTQFIDAGLIFQKTSTFILGLDDQVHIFEGNSQKNLKRKFIHCFSSQIKRLIKLNDVNVFGVELYQNHNQNAQFSQLEQNVNKLQIYVVRQDKLTKLNTVQYRFQFADFKELSFLSHINTVPYYFNFVYGKLLIVSSEQTHRYNPEKIKIQIFLFPQPFLYSKQNTNSFQKFQIVPLINISFSTLSQNQFLIWYPSPKFSSKISLFLGTFSPKFLLKQFQQQIQFNYQSTITTLQIEKKQKILFGAIQNDQENIKNKKIMVFTQNRCIHLSLNSGKMALDALNQNIKFTLLSKFGNRTQKDLRNYTGVEKIQKPLKVCHKQEQVGQQRYLNKLNEQQQKILIYNQFQIWLANVNEKDLNIKPISFYTMINNDFMEFRNNLSVQQLDQPQFIKIFSLKLPILQVKYLSDKSIILLYQKVIILLEIGQNGSLNVRQQVKFSNQKLPVNNQAQSYVQNINKIKINNSNSNQYSQIKIIELLGRYSENNIFLKDAQSRLYRFQLNLEINKYEIKFDRNLQEDIVCIGRVKGWEENKFSIPLKFTNLETRKGEIQQKQIQQIIIKKESQIVLKNLSSKKQRSYYI